MQPCRCGRHREELQPDRLAWIESRNLPTRDPEAAARLMAATARDSERCRKPVYHLAISFDPGDSVNRDTMRRPSLRGSGRKGSSRVISGERSRFVTGARAASFPNRASVPRGSSPFRKVLLLRSPTGDRQREYAE